MASLARSGAQVDSEGHKLIPSMEQGHENMGLSEVGSDG